MLGPALGGVLTQLLDWRAIFFVQAPVVAAALVVGLDPDARAVRHEGRLDGGERTGRRDVIMANMGFALVFAALVAALFLGVLLAIEVWRYSPIQGALLVRHFRRHRGRPGGDGGAAVLAAVGGTAAAGGRPGWPGAPAGRRPAAAGVASALCGVGFDLVGAVLEPAAVPPEAPAVQAAGASIGARHAGLVLGLVLIAPVLSSSLDAGIERATLGRDEVHAGGRPAAERQDARDMGAADAIEDAPTRPGPRPRGGVRRAGRDG